MSIFKRIKWKLVCFVPFYHMVAEILHWGLGFGQCTTNQEEICRETHGIWGCKTYGFRWRCCLRVDQPNESSLENGLFVGISSAWGQFTTSHVNRQSSPPFISRHRPVPKVLLLTQVLTKKWLAGKTLWSHIYRLSFPAKCSQTSLLSGVK